jgi:hypothetical protein
MGRHRSPGQNAGSPNDLHNRMNCVKQELHPRKSISSLGTSTRLSTGSISLV